MNKYYVVLSGAEATKLPPLPEDFSDVDIMLRFIRAGKTRDGGISVLAGKRPKGPKKDENGDSPKAERRRLQKRSAKSGSSKNAAAMDSLQSFF